MRIGRCGRLAWRLFVAARWVRPRRRRAGADLERLDRFQPGQLRRTTFRMGLFAGFERRSAKIIRHERRYDAGDALLVRQRHGYRAQHRSEQQPDLRLPRPVQRHGAGRLPADRQYRSPWRADPSRRLPRRQRHRRHQRRGGQLHRYRAPSPADRSRWPTRRPRAAAATPTPPSTPRPRWRRSPASATGLPLHSASTSPGPPSATAIRRSFSTAATSAPCAAASRSRTPARRAGDYPGCRRAEHRQRRTFRHRGVRVAVRQQHDRRGVGEQCDQGVANGTTGSCCASTCHVQDDGARSAVPAPAPATSPRCARLEPQLPGGRLPAAGHSSAAPPAPARCAISRRPAPAAARTARLIVPQPNGHHLPAFRWASATSPRPATASAMSVPDRTRRSPTDGRAGPPSASATWPKSCNGSATTARPTASPARRRRVARRWTSATMPRTVPATRRTVRPTRSKPSGTSCTSDGNPCTDDRMQRRSARPASIRPAMPERRAAPAPATATSPRRATAVRRPVRRMPSSPTRPSVVPPRRASCATRVSSVRAAVATCPADGVLPMGTPCRACGGRATSPRPATAVARPARPMSSSRTGRAARRSALLQRRRDVRERRLPERPAAVQHGPELRRVDRAVLHRRLPGQRGHAAARRRSRSWSSRTRPTTPRTSWCGSGSRAPTRRRPSSADPTTHRHLRTVHLLRSDGRR